MLIQIGDYGWFDPELVFMVCSEPEIKLGGPHAGQVEKGKVKIYFRDQTSVMTYSCDQPNVVRNHIAGEINKCLKR